MSQIEEWMAEQELKKNKVLALYLPRRLFFALPPELWDEFSVKYPAQEAPR